MKSEWRSPGGDCDKHIGTWLVQRRRKRVAHTHIFIGEVLSRMELLRWEELLKAYSLFSLPSQNMLFAKRNMCARNAREKELGKRVILLITLPLSLRLITFASEDATEDQVVYVEVSRDIRFHLVLYFWNFFFVEGWGLGDCNWIIILKNYDSTQSTLFKMYKTLPHKVNFTTFISRGLILIKP